MADVEFRKIGHGVDYPGMSGASEKFSAQIGDVARRIGAQKLGCTLHLVPPGKRAWPFHNHRVNEEMFVVLEGEGEVRIGQQTHPIRRGDVIVHPPGGPETAHQIVNTSNAELKYLAISTRLSPEIVDYPDSNKFGVLAEQSGPDGRAQPWRFMGRVEGNINYWDGE
jgi:uncharacterized cupin superfamily protein